MPRLAISSGARVTLNHVADWPIDIVEADLSGQAKVCLPWTFLGTNRPSKVHVVYFPGYPTPGISVDTILGSGPHEVVDVPGPSTGDVTLTVQVAQPLPLGLVTVLAIGEFDN